MKASPAHLTIDNPCTTITALPTPSPQGSPRTPSESAWWALLESPQNTSHRDAGASPSCVGLWDFMAEDYDENLDDANDDDSDDDILRQSFSSVDEGAALRHMFRGFFRCGGDATTILTDNKYADGPCALLSDVREFAFAHEDPENDDIFEISSSDDDSGVVKDVWERGYNVFDELEEEISFLRERTDAIKTSSSKYKTMVSRKELARRATLKAKEQWTMQDVTKPASPRRVAFIDDSSKKENTDSKPKKVPAKKIFAKLNPSAESAGKNTSRDITPPPQEPRITKVSFAPADPGESLQVFRATSADLKEDTEMPPPVKIVDPFASDWSPAPGADDLLHGMSTLTQGSLSFALDRGSSNNRFKPGNLSMPPNILKKLQKLKNLKIRQRSTGGSSVVSGPSLTHSCVNTVFTGQKSSPFLYESNPKVNSYVAYFRRGGRADETVRIYEHVTPSVFPTAENEMVVRIEASTVSGTDCQVRKSEFWGEGTEQGLNLPIIPGVAFVGTVIQVPKSGLRSGNGLHTGDRVVSLVRCGANARHICISADKLVKVPDTIQNYAAAACLPELYLSAFQALHIGQRNGARYRKSSLSGKSILVLGGATAVGRAVIEVALAGGCDTVYATGKEKQFDAISSVGGTPLGRDPKQWGSILEGRVHMLVGIDDSIGQSELSIEHMALLRPVDGRVVLFCAPEQEESTVINLDEQTCATASTSGRRIFQHNVFDAWGEDQKQAKRDLAHVLKLLAEGHVTPRILERVPLTRVAKAQDLMDGKKLNGFILCEPWIKGRLPKESRDELNSPPKIKTTDTRETIENIPQTPVKSTLSAVVDQYSPLALFGDSVFWKTVTENRWTGGTEVDPNRTPTAANLKRTRDTLSGQSHLQNVIEN